MLEWAPWLVLTVAGEVDLAILADNAAGGLDEDRGIEATHIVSSPLDLGKAEMETDAPSPFPSAS
jgi:hypothetical protein